MLCPEKRLYFAIVKQAVKDFHRGCSPQTPKEAKEKIIVFKWVVNEEGTFPLCSIAYASNPNLLKEKLLKVFERLENGEELRAT